MSQGLVLWLDESGSLTGATQRGQGGVMQVQNQSLFCQDDP